MQGGDKTIVGGTSMSATPGKLPNDLYVSIEVVEGPDQGQNFQITKTHTTFGRGEDNDVRFRDPTVSGRHASIEFIGTDFMVVDMGSSNGTFVNGVQVDKEKIKNMDELRFGSTKVFISMVQDVYGTYAHQTGAYGDEEETKEVDPNGLTVPRMPKPNPDIPTNLRVRLIVVEGPDEGKQYDIRRQSTILGRAEYADFQILDEAISRRHCQILIRNKEFMGIKDLASTNHTFLNDRHVSAVQLDNEDIIKIGDSKIKFLFREV